MRTQRVAVARTIVNLLLLAVIVAGGIRPLAAASAASAPQALAAESEEAPILRGRALEIVDERGKTRSRLNVESDGEVVLRMADRNGIRP
jgi:hypothetical protein